MKNSELCVFLDSFAPFGSAEGFDNCGLILGSPETDHQKILLALDVTPDVLTEAKEKGATLIVTHHPVIFNPLKSLSSDTMVYRLISEGIDVISAHTNLDKAEGGVNDTLIGLLGFSKLRPLEESHGCAALCSVPDGLSSAKDIAGQVIRSLGLNGVRLYDAGKPVQQVAVCCGGGGSFLDAAVSEGAQLFLTGDLRHNHVISAAEKGISLIDAGHFETEDIVLPVLAKRFAGEFPGCEFTVADSDRPLFIYIANNTIN